ncbi:MAG: hypothetical protein ACFB21_02930 [Opitutales bacterium]
MSDDQNKSEEKEPKKPSDGSESEHTKTSDSGKEASGERPETGSQSEEKPAETKAEALDPKAIAEGLSTEQTTRLVTFLQDEIKKAKRGVTMTYSFGLIVCLILGGYMAWALYNLNQTVLDPEQLAMFIGDSAEEQVPGLVSELENYLIDTADDQAEELSNRFLELAPQIFAAARNQIDATYQEDLPLISAEFSTIIREYLRENEEALKAFAEANSNEEFAEFFISELMAELETQLNAWMAEEFEGRDLSYVQENIRLAMMAMNEKLEELIEKPVEELTRQERMQRRILAHLYLTAVKAAAEDRASE